jgi:hypothetical protein
MGAAAGDIDRLPVAGDLDDPESAEDLLGLGKRPIAHERLAIAHPRAPPPHRLGGGAAVIRRSASLW